MEFPIKDSELFIYQLINFSEKWEYFTLLNSNSIQTGSHLYSSFEMIAACDSITQLKHNEFTNFQYLKNYYNESKDWIFGHLSYDLKNEVENLTSENEDRIEFPDLFFYVPRFVIIINSEKLKVGYLPDFDTDNEIERIIDKIKNININNCNSDNYANNIVHNFSEEEYIFNVNEIKHHIGRGDIYEMNFCTEFFSNDALIDAPKIYESLNKLSPAPYSAYYKVKDKYLISSSPERFLAKRGNKIISQPIKGTIKRGKNREEDLKLIAALESDEKERAENIMIVDLVRNDLSRTSKIGTVIVEELCKTYSYKYVHQLISTVVAELDEENHDSIDAIKNSFPMGSMTGAPKVKAMQLIEQYEKSKRGLYSGAVGYFSPDGNFDFNVVIRSILYNKTKKTLSFSVGSAITYKSLAEKEYQECLLKAAAMREVLTCTAKTKK